MRVVLHCTPAVSHPHTGTALHLHTCTTAFWLIEITLTTLNVKIKIDAVNKLKEEIIGYTKYRIYTPFHLDLWVFVHFYPYLEGVRNSSLLFISKEHFKKQYLSELEKHKLKKVAN